MNQHATRRPTVLISLLFLAMLLPGFLTPTARAQTSVNESRPAPAEGRVSVENLAGSVTVQGWDKNEVSVTGTLAKDCTLEFSSSGDHTTVAVKWPRTSGRHEGGTDITVQVPAKSEVDVNTVSADITLGGVSGASVLESVSGIVVVKDLSTNIEAKTVSGDIRITAPARRLRAESVSGDLELNGPSGEAELSDVSGSIRITGGQFSRVTAESVSGGIHFDGGVEKDARFEVTSHSGDVELLLPADLSAELSAESLSGDIVSDFGGKAERKSRYAPGKQFEFTVGSGDAHIEASSFSGTVTLKKK